MSSGKGNAFRVECPSCGRVLMAPLALAGKKAKCPDCGNVLQVPAAAPPPTPTPAPTPQPLSPFASPGSGMSGLLDEALAEPTPSPSSYATEAPQPTMRPRVTAESYLRNKPRPQRSAVDTGSIFGGIGLMGLAVVWFVVGLFCDYIFFYPPILFVIGLASFCKGLASTVFR